jgi:hypothetical protein
MAHEDGCGCCLRMRELLAGIFAEHKIGERLDGLHRQLTRVQEGIDQIMAAQDDVNNADSALQQLVTLAPEIVSALQAGGTPVDTAQLATDTTSAESALSSIQAALPAPASPPAGSGTTAAPAVPASPF